MTCDTGHIGDGEHCVKISGPKLKRFGSYDVLKIFPQRMTHLINQLMNYGGVCRTAPATQGLLITLGLLVFEKLTFKIKLLFDSSLLNS